MASACPKALPIHTYTVFVKTFQFSAVRRTQSELHTVAFCPRSRTAQACGLECNGMSSVGVVQANPEQSKHLDTATFAFGDLSVDVNQFRSETSPADLGSRGSALAGSGLAA